MLKLPEAVLVAGNVPIGLYESVFDYAGPAKYLKGWRYVGSSPFGSGGLPNGVDAQAMQNAQKGCPACSGPGSVMQGPLFGLVFFNGALTFRQLDEIANNMTCPQYVKPVSEPAALPTRPGGAQPVGEPTRGGGATSTPETEEERRRREEEERRRRPGTTESPSLPQTNPGAAWRNAPRLYSLPLDAGVRQTSSSSSWSGAKGGMTTKAGTTAPKPVDPKKLQALEAEAFKSLDYSPATGAKGSPSARSPYAASPALPSTTSDSPVPALTPAISIR
jgi:hypothetical protein